MNERIKELIKQCTSWSEGSTWTSREVFDKEKFAELIVKECASKAWFAEQYGIGDGAPVSKQIKEHFGVEE
jgi:hypothetical protein